LTSPPLLRYPGKKVKISKKTRKEHDKKGKIQRTDNHCKYPYPLKG